MKIGTFQIPNYKFQQTTPTTGNYSLSDFNRNDYGVIMKHLWSKLNSKPKDWRRIFKSMHAMEYLIKNGAPRVVQDVKDDMFKIRAL